MATVMAKPVPIRKISKLPSRMASRNQEIRAVGAWVQPEPSYRSECVDAVLSAQLEEARIQDKQAQKEARLHQFQEDVKNRVKALNKLKHLQQMEKTFRAVEAERNIVKQSAFSAEKITPRKNRCTLFQGSQDLTIKPSHSSSTEMLASSDDDAFKHQTEEVQKLSQQARKNLTSCKVIRENYMHNGLPGGLWKQGSTRDNPASRSMGEVYDWLLDDDDTSNKETDEQLVERHDEEEEETEEQQLERVKSVHFAPSPISDNHIEVKQRCKSASSALLPPVPDLHPGVANEEERQQAVGQRAMYRRLFMDIEREQVKENIRRKEHRKKIHKLKKNKEQERQKIEETVRQAVSADPVTGETLNEQCERETARQESMRQQSREVERRLQKGRENNRYLEALKKNLQDKIRKQNIDLPPLCCCGPSAWDTNPETCANNCIFYKNPKAYARALQSLLSSCDVA